MAVAQNGRALQHASAGLRADRKVVLVAVAQNGFALAYAPAELQADREVVLVAMAQAQYTWMAQDGGALRFVLTAGPAFILAVAQDGAGWPPSRMNGPQKAQDGRILFHVSDELLADREFILAAVAQDGRALMHAPDELKADREVVLAAVAQNAGALQHASEELQTTSRAALLADAAKLRAGGRLVASLQRLAFAACFTDASHFSPAGGGPSSTCELAACLANVPTDLFEVVRQSPVLHELPGLELIDRAREQGWAWRSATGLGLRVTARAPIA